MRRILKSVETPEPPPPSMPTADGLIEPGDALRARMQFLVAQHQALIGQTQFADAKAAALMTLIGIIALRGPFPGEKMLSHPAGVALALLSAIAIVACLWAIIPRYPKKQLAAAAKDGDAFSWTALASNGWTPTQYADFARDGDFASLIAALAASNVGASRVLAKKFQAMRIATAAAMSAVLLIVGVYGWAALRTNGFI